MKQTVDARGLACPQPVVLTSKAMTVADQVTVIVDNDVAVENISRLARSKGFTLETTEKTDGIYLILCKTDTPSEAAEKITIICDSQPSSGKTVIFVPSDCLGRGPVELGERLMSAFFHAILDIGPKPTRIIFMNTGVNLVVEGSRALDDLRVLARKGIDILACGTCLSYFNLTEKLAVEHVSNMYDIASALLEADKIVEL